MNWNYYVLPGFVARVYQEHVEIKDPKNCEWKNQEESTEMLHMISRDGTKVDKNEAEEAFEYFKSHLKG